MANINVKGFMILAVSLIVSIILVTGVLIPVISNTTGGGEKTYTNTGDFFETIDSNTNHTYTVGQTTGDNGILTVFINMDDVPMKEWIIDLNKTSGTLEQTSFFYPILIFDTPNGKGMEGIAYSQLNAYNLNGEGAVDWASFTSEDLEIGFFDETGETVSRTITINNGIVDYEIGDLSPDDKQYTHCLSNEGDYVFSHSPYIKNDTEIATCIIHDVAEISDSQISTYFGFNAYMSGNIQNLTPAKYTYGSGELNSKYYNIQDTVYDTHKTDNDSVIKLDNVTATVTYVRSNGTDTIEKEWIIDQFFVPVNIGSGSSSSVSPAVATILSVIPLIVTVGLIIGTVGYFIRRQ